MAGAVVAGVVAAWPASALASERSLTTPDDTWIVAGVTVLGLLGVFVASAVGYLYRRERGLDWEFQRPDEPHDEDH
jgi:hypothetical protein